MLVKATEVDVNTLTLVCPNGLARESLKRTIQDQGFEVEAVAGIADLSLSRDTTVLIDPPHTKIAVSWVSSIRGRFPASKVVVTIPPESSSDLGGILRAGAIAVLSTAVEPALLGASLRLASADLGDISFPDAPSVKTVPGKPLSRRQLDVLHYFAKGLNNDAIAKEMGLSVETVKAHITQVFRKTKSVNRVEAAVWASTNGLLQETRVTRPKTPTKR